MSESTSAAKLTKKAVADELTRHLRSMKLADLDTPVKNSIFTVNKNKLIIYGPTGYKKLSDTEFSILKILSEAENHIVLSGDLSTSCRLEKDKLLPKIQGLRRKLRGIDRTNPTNHFLSVDTGRREQREDSWKLVKATIIFTGDPATPSSEEPESAL